MRKIYPLFLLLFFTYFSQAQELNIKGLVTVQADGLLHVQGDVLIDNTGTLDIQSNGAQHGKVEVQVPDINSPGQWTCDGTTSSTVGGEGEVYFLGLDVDYDVQGTNVSFPNMIVDISTSVGGFNIAKININDSTHIARTLDLKNGRLVTDATTVVYVSNNAPDAIRSTDAGYGDARSNFVQGSLRRAIATGPTNYYHFPIGCQPGSTGNKRGYNPAFIDLRTGAGTINARKPANATSIVAKFEEISDPGIIHHHQLAHSCYSTSTQYQFLELHWMVKDFGYWDLKPNGNPQGWWYTFYAKPDVDYIFDYNNLTHMKVIKAPRDFQPGPTADWSDYVEESGNGCDGVNIYNSVPDMYWKPGPNTPNFALTDSIRASELTTFSRFGLSGGIGAGLPIELLYLEAHPVNNSYISVNWATATEIENSGFEVQRSTDGVNFEVIHWEPGAGNSSITLNYGINDHDVVPNQLYYYRLRQVDFNGADELTYIVSAMITSSTTFTISEFIPNPTQYGSRIEVTTSVEKDVNITVFNTLGQIMSRRDQHLVPGTNRIDFDFNLLADGTYYAIFHADNEIFNRKLILTK